MRYLQRAGYRCIPVNPNADEVLGERCYPSLADCPSRSTSSTCSAEPSTARTSPASRGDRAPALWLQLGLRSAEARDVAEEAGMEYVEDACTAVVHRRL